ncbi:MAG: methionyl-tRNA formyltransferase [Treponema sp.]|uniref:methionyl-tRNA formyltransferase n=1 Tax=Treponema sp. TaxID=166 RepID=UPI001B646635|nr:methionyl-tRNA formyltransferase [Treponema sp.]MBP5402627.1 methionyl-tRNA formyltransferase [Treponema sp.]MBR5933790.1 methionyl-tRNA formyltransferase [Treponema sp.]
MIRVLYAGSPEASAETLKILLQNSAENNFKIAGVLSNAPAAKGRHKELVMTPVAQFAIQNDIPVFTPEHLDSNAREEISKINADILVCFAYGHIFGPKFLSMFRLGGINLHPSLLPKYRGCTPVPAAILNRDKETAFSVQTLSLKMDEGNILAQKKVELKGTETGGSLLNDAAVCGAELITELLSDADKNGCLKKGNPQTGEASYTAVISKEDGKLDWNLSSLELDAKIRAYNPEPGCFCFFTSAGKTDNLRIFESSVIESSEGLLINSAVNIDGYKTCEPGKVLLFDKPTGIWVKTGDGILALKKLQKPGKNAMGYKDFMNGTRDFIGSVLK